MDEKLQRVTIIKRKEDSPTLEELLKVKADIESDIATFKKIARRKSSKGALMISDDFAVSKGGYYKNRIDELKNRLMYIEDQIKECQKNGWHGNI